jgi:hypothetical protein
MGGRRHLLLTSLLLAACDNSLEARCRRGDGQACGVLADRLRHDAAHGQDLGPACDLYRRACRGNNDVACANLGALLAQKSCVAGAGEALSVLERACDRGHAAACNNLGMLLRDGGDGVPADRARAVAAFRKACASAPVACDNLGALLLDADPAGARAAFEAGCALRPVSAEGATCCFKAGLAAENGWGAPPDRDRARTLYTDACDRSVAGACYSLGLLDLRPPDPAGAARAARLFAKACDLGTAGACNNLGLMLAQGIGVPADAARAATLLQKACDGGELRACANVGSRYLLGDGVAKDEARGRELIERACKGGVREACPPAP